MSQNLLEKNYQGILHEHLEDLILAFSAPFKSYANKVTIKPCNGKQLFIHLPVTSEFLNSGGDFLPALILEILQRADIMAQNHKMQYVNISNVAPFAATYNMYTNTHNFYVVFTIEFTGRLL
jgi:hypothetical protein